MQQAQFFLDLDTSLLQYFTRACRILLLLQLFLFMMWQVFHASMYNFFRCCVCLVWLTLYKSREARKKIQEEIATWNKSIDEMTSENEEAEILRLQDEIKECKAILKCGVCFDRPKEVCAHDIFGSKLFLIILLKFVLSAIIVLLWYFWELCSYSHEFVSTRHCPWGTVELVNSSAK